jgi:Helix-turn-helix domain
MLVRQAFRYELAPTTAQRAALSKHAGAARWAWNWGLSVRRKAFQRRGQTLGGVELHRLLNQLKRTPGYGWLYEVSKCAPQEALGDLDRADQMFWQGRKAGRRGGLPRWKRRGRGPDRFRLTGTIKVEPDAVVLPRLGRVATKEPTGKFAKWGGRVLSATCRREADRWYCSLTVEVTRPDRPRLSGRWLASTGASTPSRSAPTAPRSNPHSVAAEPAHPAPPFAGGQPQAEGLPQPGQGHAGAGALPPEGPQPAAGCAPQGHHDAGESQVGDRGGGPACGRAGAQPPPRPRHQ